ncbi:MAG: hypothetical protein QXG48_01470 [Thermofilaceae archaeon]
MQEKKGGEKRDIPVRDFLEEHKRLKGANPPASPATSQPAAPQAPTALPASPQPPQPTAARPQEFITVPHPITFAQLVESLKELGYDVRPLESLKVYAQTLDGEEQRLVKEIEERQRRLEVVRAARKVLRTLGV